MFKEHASRIVDRLNPILALEVEIPDRRLTPASPYSNRETSIKPRDFRAPPKRHPVSQNAAADRRQLGEAELVPEA
jgi:hypothetical protein